MCILHYLHVHGSGADTNLAQLNWYSVTLHVGKAIHVVPLYHLIWVPILGTRSVYGPFLTLCTVT